MAKPQRIDVGILSALRRACPEGFVVRTASEDQPGHDDYPDNHYVLAPETDIPGTRLRIDFQFDDLGNLSEEGLRYMHLAPMASQLSAAMAQKS